MGVEYPSQEEEGWKCPSCGLVRGADLVDPCLGKLPGVKYACCGHGGLTRSAGGYITFDNDIVIRFELESVERAHRDHEGNTTWYEALYADPRFSPP